MKSLWRTAFMLSVFFSSLVSAADYSCESEGDVCITEEDSGAIQVAYTTAIESMKENIKKAATGKLVLENIEHDLVGLAQALLAGVIKNADLRGQVLTAFENEIRDNGAVAKSLKLSKGAFKKVGVDFVLGLLKSVLFDTIYKTVIQVTDKYWLGGAVLAGLQQADIYLFSGGNLGKILYAEATLAYDMWKGAVTEGVAIWKVNRQIQNSEAVGRLNEIYLELLPHYSKCVDEHELGGKCQPDHWITVAKSNADFVYEKYNTEEVRLLVEEFKRSVERDYIEFVDRHRMVRVFKMIEEGNGPGLKEYLADYFYDGDYYLRLFHFNHFFFGDLEETSEIYRLLRQMYFEHHVSYQDAMIFTPEPRTTFAPEEKISSAEYEKWLELLFEEIDPRFGSLSYGNPNHPFKIYELGLMNDHYYKNIYGDQYFQCLRKTDRRTWFKFLHYFRKEQPGDDPALTGSTLIAASRGLAATNRLPNTSSEDGVFTDITRSDSFLIGASMRFEYDNMKRKMNSCSGGPN